MLYHHDLPDCQKKEIPLLKRHAAEDLLPAAYTISIIPTTRIAGGLFILQSSVFRISEKLLNGEQGLALTIISLYFRFGEYRLNLCGYLYNVGQGHWLNLRYNPMIHYRI